MGDTCTFVAVSNTTARVCNLDSNGKPTYVWTEATGQAAQGSVNWLRNGKAFLTTQGGSVAAHVVDALKDKEKAPIILTLPSGPLLSRVSGDGKCLVVVQSGVPGSISVYDLQSLLVSASGTPAKPPVILQDHDRPILAIAASVSTTHVASSNSIGAVYLHEAGSGARATIGPLAGGPMLMTPKRCLAFSQASKPLRLAAGADDGQVLVWQISPMASGPVVMPNKLRGRVMGVGFAAYNKVPASVLLACSESGQLCVIDLRSFPNVQSQASFSVELSVAVSCMMVRDDGQLVAVGTKDGRVGCSELTSSYSTDRHNVAKAGLIKVFDIGTHLDVMDVAFQRMREHRESRDSTRESKDSAATPTPVPAAAVSAQEQLSTQQATPADAADGRPGSGWVAELGELLDEEPPLKRHAAHSVLMAAGSVSQRQPPEKQEGPSARGGLTGSTTGPTAAGMQHRQAPVPTTSVGSAPGFAAQPTGAQGNGSTPGSAGPAPTSGPSSQPGNPQPSSSQQPQAPRHPGVTPVVIPGIAPPIGSHKRPSDMGGNASSSTTPTGGQDEAAGGDGPTVSPAARTLVGGAVASTSSPVSSPSRPRSPRATVSGGGYPLTRPHGSTGGDVMSAAGLRTYLDDFRQEVRDLVRGLQADMVRQTVAAEMAHRNDIALLQQENRMLLEEVRRLSQQLDANLRFGLLGQQGPPWQ